MQSSWQRFIRKLEASNEVYKESVNEYHHMKIFEEGYLVHFFYKKKTFSSRNLQQTQKSLVYQVN